MGPRRSGCGRVRRTLLPAIRAISENSVCVRMLVGMDEVASRRTRFSAYFPLCLLFGIFFSVKLCCLSVLHPTSSTPFALMFVVRTTIISSQIFLVLEFVSTFTK